MNGKKADPKMHWRGGFELTKTEYASFKSKLTSFRASLNEKELRIFDIGMPEDSPQESASAGTTVPDSRGARQLDDKRIREPDGTTITCAAGSSTQLVPDGQGGSNWLCVSNT